MANDIRNRIESKIIPEPNSGCWIWTGMLNDAGYGLIAMRIGGKKRQRRAHRIYYELVKGKISEKLTLDHLCRVRCCVNPDHLEPVTPVENVMRGESFYATQARKTHCPKGHPYAGANLRITPHGGRLCRICVARRVREYQARNKEKVYKARAVRQKRKRLFDLFV